MIEPAQWVMDTSTFTHFFRAGYGHVLGAVAPAGIVFVPREEGLEEILGRPVDVVTPSGLANPYFRRGVMQTRELVYAA